MKIAILGSTGMAGHMVAAYMEQQGFQVYRISRSEENSERSCRIDVTELDRLTEYIAKINADVIINCVGLLQKTCEQRPDLAILVNSYLPHFLENYYQNTHVKIVHLSTDCVFSGLRGDYLENDLQDGRTLYDRTKALGELNNSKDLTFRMSIIGPDPDPSGTGLFNWFMQQSGTIYGYSKFIWNGITTLELAQAISQALEEGLSGLYQLVPDKSISKYHLLLLFKEIFHKSDVDILENESFTGNKSLCNTRKDFSYHVNDYKTQILNLREWIYANSHLYPAFYKSN